MRYETRDLGWALSARWGTAPDVPLAYFGGIMIEISLPFAL